MTPARIEEIQNSTPYPESVAVMQALMQVWRECAGDDLHERKFRDLPLGARFRYQINGDTWVVLERHDCGLIVKWTGLDGWNAGQAICSAEDSPERCADLMVYALNN